MQVWEKHLFLSFPLLADRSRLGGSEAWVDRVRSFVVTHGVRACQELVREQALRVDWFPGAH